MPYHHDWDDAFSNSAYIAGAEDLPAQWATHAAAFRNQMTGRMRSLQYGDHPRQAVDLFLPENAPVGLVVFVHGGYWLACAKEDWSDRAAGLLAHGYAVAMPSYRLAPEADFPAIAADVAAAITCVAGEVAGPLILTGHSAGGHLVSRLIADGSPLADGVITKIKRVVPISGLFYLRPLRMTKMQEVLHITPAQSMSESPALLLPHHAFSGDIHLWVGAEERPEFLRQSQLMHLMWKGFAPIDMTVEGGRHHFSVLNGLNDPVSDLVAVITR